MPPDLKKVLEMTHFVRIPLVTPASLPQILESYSRIQRDTISAVIPRGAFTHPANLHLTIGSLSLPTPSHVEAALEVLRSAITRQVDRPFTVHLVGIRTSLVTHKPRDLTRTMRLYSRIEDPTNCLQRFCQGVRSTLQDEGLLKQLPWETNELPPQTRLMDTRRLARDSTMAKSKYYPRPGFDATGIHRKYKDCVLMKDVRLQELHISELGRKKVLYEDVMVDGYRNIATLSLPGTAGDGTRPLQSEMVVSIPVRDPN